MKSWALAPDQVGSYHQNGFLFPLDMMSSSEAGTLRNSMQAVLARTRNDPKLFRYIFYASHLVVPEVHDLARDHRILDRVESVLGPDLLLWSSSLFIKEPRTTDYVSWHQDLAYWGLDDESRELTAWVAITEAIPSNGAMRFVPGSHKTGIIEHRDTWRKDIQLSRGQEIAVEVDESEAVSVELQAGQMSFHHGSLFHASGPNRTNATRIGLALRYVTPEMNQVVGSVDYATLVRGEDRFGNFRPAPDPVFDLEAGDFSAIDSALRHRNAYLFSGVEEMAPSLPD